MRYRVRLVNNLKNNYVKIPADSALRSALNMSSAANGISSGQFMSSANQTSHCNALKLQLVGDDDYQPRTYYFGFVGGVSAEPNTIELSQEAGALMHLEDDMLL